ncbi:zinc-ribbon domain-containing protein [Halorussus salilacus]|uniref:zinc-ribbon domain-containing protein n=1 Tax=Halorussus salilacus TaxID=2953750 RepID=UPI0020A0F313|nr:zinc-ribbon domain-containing protein [Halorussus salilacus]USZ68609.1 zinc-ribbon domain-containing protein [Halorussus salilacus]
MTTDQNDSADGTARSDDAPPTTDRIDALERAVEALAEEVSDLERTVAWMARQQARETGNGACPRCHTGGALRVERTPAGKKRVTCSNCEGRFD